MGKEALMVEAEVLMLYAIMLGKLAHVLWSENFWSKSVPDILVIFFNFLGVFLF